MNDIFNTDVPLKTETPAFAKHVLPAVPSSEVYLEDCVTALKRYADNHFDLAIVDPPYGIDVAKTGKVGGNNAGKAKDYGAKEWDKQPPNEEYFRQLFRVSKNQIVRGLITLLVKCHTIAAAGLCGIKTIQETLLIVNWLGLHLILQ